MYWLTLLPWALKKKLVWVHDGNDVAECWMGRIAYVTPWALALDVSFDDPAVVSRVIFPMSRVYFVRDGNPSSSRNMIKNLMDYNADGMGPDGITTRV
mgnify:FL=1